MSKRPNASPNREERLDEAVAAIVEAAESGSVPDRAHWLARYPDLLDELAQFFEDQEQLELLTRPLRSLIKPDIDATLQDRRLPWHVGGPRLPFSRFADYELLAEVGRGGMGVVYKAKQLSLPRVVALKMIRSLNTASA
jgi:serine/threonine-protein kinase